MIKRISSIPIVQTRNVNRAKQLTIGQSKQKEIREMIEKQFVASKSIFTLAETSAKIWLMLIVTLAISGTCFAYNIYVNKDSTAPGTPDGSSSLPYLTIQEAIAKAFDDNDSDNQSCPPVRIIVHGPTAEPYEENLCLVYGTETTAHNVSDITIQGDSDSPESCIIVPTTNNFIALLVYGRNNSKLSLKNLKISRNNIRDASTGLLISSVSQQGGCSMQKLSVENCKFTNHYIAIYSYHPAEEVIINKSTIESVKEDIYPDMPGGILLSGSGSVLSNATITNNDFNFHVNLLDVTRLSEAIWLSDFSYIIAQCNKFKNGYLCLGNSIPTASIMNNTFIADDYQFSGLHDNAIILINTDDSTNANCSISKNTIWNYPTPILLGKHFPAQIIRYTATISKNSFINCQRIATIYHNPNQTPPTNRIALYQDNLYLGQSSSPFLILDLNDQVIPLYGDDRIPVSYSLFSASLNADESLIMDSNITNENPEIALDNITYTYTPIWNNEVRSPLINSGCPAINGIPQTDPDGTPPDIGAIYYPHHHKEYQFSDNDIFWMSFPVIDDRSHEGEQHYDMLGYLFEEQMEYAPTFNQLNSASWSYNLDFDNMHYDNVQHLWDNDDKEVTQPQGFKLKFNDGDISPIVVIGFKVDHETTPVELAINTGDNLPFDNWIGYYVPDVQLAGVALSRLLPNSQNETYLDHIYRIKAQYWSTERISPEYGSRWIVDPNHYTLSEGDMISIFLLPNAPKSLYWNTPHISVDPRIRELPVNFTYKEELDYTPIFIEFDPNDLPQEVGLYVSGVCKGAAVVDSSLIEVNYYGTEAKSGDEIEVMFYYGDKGMKKAPAAYVYNPETLLFEAGSLKASNLGDYGYLSFNRGEGSSLVPLVTELKQNYPNPFKAQTNISWILAKDAPVSVDIYNLRGQKVKTLFSGLGQKGRQSLAWDATDLHGNKVASGVYFWRLSTPETTKVQKMLVLK